MKRDFEKMVKDIDDLLETDQAADLVDHVHWIHPEADFTQEDAIEMSKLLGKIYMIAHGITCCCGDKYEQKIINP